MNADLSHIRRIMALATGDEKHDSSAHSTLDVLWVLYDRILRYDPRNPRSEERDRFILSKGHGPVAFYAILADKGFSHPLPSPHSSAGTASWVGIPTATRCRAWRSLLARWDMACQWPWAWRWDCERRKVIAASSRWLAMASATRAASGKQSCWRAISISPI